MSAPTWRTRAAFLFGASWKWVTWTHSDGSRHAAIIRKGRELGANGWDFGNADHERSDRANF